MKSFLWEIAKTFLFICATLGVPIYFITNKYDVYEAVAQNPIQNQLGAWGFVLAVISIPIVILILKALIHKFPPRLPKRLLWGFTMALPVFVGLMLSKWIIANIDFIQTMLTWWAGTLFISWVVAPQFLIDYKNGGSK